MAQIPSGVLKDLRHCELDHVWKIHGPAGTLATCQTCGKEYVWNEPVGRFCLCVTALTEKEKK